MELEDRTITVAFVGHVDHGKSSILGRLLAETQTLPEGKLEQLKAYCQTHAKDFEYAYLIDTLAKEQSQGITIDTARYFVRSGTKKFVFIDTPGHLDFIKNMMTGSSRADIALLIIDAKEGIKENTLRHAYLLSFLRIETIIVLINKMDLVGYSQETFLQHSDAIAKVLHSHRLAPAAILPISAKEGDHFTTASPNMPWYRGLPLWESLSAHIKPQYAQEGAFRMPLQDIYRFSKEGDARRIYGGTLTSGHLKKGDAILFAPSQKEGIVASIESERDQPTAGFAAGFTLESPLFVDRGELAYKKGDSPPLVGNRFKTRLFWISGLPLSIGTKYTFRIHTCQTTCSIEKILAVYDSKDEEEKKTAEAKTYDIVECVIRTQKPIAFDLSFSFFETSRFALVDQFQMLCGGNILENLPLETLSSKQKLRVVAFENPTLAPSLEAALAQRVPLAYTIRIGDFKAEKEACFAMLKVCRDLKIVSLLQHPPGCAPEIESALSAHFGDVVFHSIASPENLDTFIP